MEKIPKNHPRYNSLKTREKLSKSVKNGITHYSGLIAHGRGEAFDYILGEKTNKFAYEAEAIAAAALLIADNPVISINGNVAALNPKDCINLSNEIPAKLEINLFHRTNDRVNKIFNELKKNGAVKIYGKKADAIIPFLDHNRGLCDKDGIFSADVILVPLEDGDRCQALKRMGKKVIAIDLNPLSRTAMEADISIIDNVFRAIPNIEYWVKKYKKIKKENLKNMLNNWNNKLMLKNILNYISKRLNLMF
jgi:4-phosphopantoate--beta-alanine ligase